MARRYFVASFIFTSCLVAVAGQNKYGLLEQRVKLNPGITGRPDEILWKHNGNKVVEFDGMEQQVYSRYENRVILDWHTAELDIADIQFEDSGDYELEVFVNRKLHRSNYKLEVIDKVKKPTISCEIQDGSSSNISGMLVCSAELSEPQFGMKFEWISQGNVHNGPNLTISLGDELDEEEYRCRVSNPLSNDTATFIGKDCYADKSSSGALIAALIIIFVLLLLALIGIVFCKRSHKACFAKGKEDNLEKQASSGETGGNVRDKINHFEGMGAGKTPDVKLTKESDKETAPDDENRPLLDSSLTPPSTESLGHLDSVNALKRNNDEQKEAVSPSLQHNEAPSHMDQNNRVSSDDSDDYDDAEAGPADTGVSHCSNEPEPIEVESSAFSEHRESDEVTAQDEENRPLLESSLTPPSTERLGHLDSVNDLDKNEDKQEKIVSPPSSLHKETQHIDPAEGWISSNEPEPAGVSANCREDKKSDEESSAASGHPGNVRDKINHFEGMGAGKTPDVKLTKESDKETAPDDENWPLLDSSLTPPSTESLGHLDSVNALKRNKDEQKEAVSPPSLQHNEAPSHLDQNNQVSSDDSDDYHDAEAGPADTGVSHCSNEPEPTGVSTECCGDSTSEVESSALSEHRESEEVTAQDDENRPLRDSSLTSPSTERLGHLDSVNDLDKNEDKQEKIVSPPSSLHKETQHIDPAEGWISSNEPEPAGVSANCREDKKSDEESSAASGHPESDEVTAQHDENRPLLDSSLTSSSTERLGHLDSVNESENKDEEAKFDPGSDHSPALQPNSPLPPSSPNAVPEDISGENKKDVSSDQVAKKPATNFRESDSSTTPEHKASETSNNKQA